MAPQINGLSTAGRTVGTRIPVAPTIAALPISVNKGSGGCTHPDFWDLTLFRTKKCCTLRFFVRKSVMNYIFPKEREYLSSKYERYDQSLYKRFGAMEG